MRASISWDVDLTDPEFHRIIFDLASVLPPDRTVRLTSWMALVDPITTHGFRELSRAVDAVAQRYADRLFVVLSLHPAGSVIWGRWRPPGADLLVTDDTLGFGPGPGIPD